MAGADQKVPVARARIPSGVWVLGSVSLLMDVSSEMIHSLLPLFMVTTLGLGALTVLRPFGGAALFGPPRRDAVAPIDTMLPCPRRFSAGITCPDQIRRCKVW